MFGSLLGGILGSSAQRRAAKESAAVSREGLAQQQRQFDRAWDSADPFIQAGVDANARLIDPNAFQTSPGYNFRLQQGLDAVGTNQAVNGLLRSGGAMKAMNDYAQGMASDEYGRWFGQQSSIADRGMQGVGVGAGIATNSANAIGQNTTNQGNALLAGANAQAAMLGQVGGAIDRFGSSYGGW